MPLSAEIFSNKRLLHSQVVGLAFSIAMLLVGCGSEVQVSTYTVERTEPTRRPLDIAAVQRRRDHILVAVVPQEGQAWFFKLVGKAPAIERQRAAFEGFLAQVQLASGENETPTWTLPDGWKEKENAEALRAATLLVPDAEGELELAVSSLPFKGKWEDFLVPNVNRWLRQLQQIGIRDGFSQETILKLAHQVPIQNGEATLFELSGELEDRPMSNMSQSGTKGLARPPATTASRELAYEMPEGWSTGRMTSMRKAAFSLPDGGPTDEVTVTRFADAAQMGDVAFNVQRWAGQIGATRPMADELAEMSETISIDGIEGTYVELLGSADATPSGAIFAAMVKREGQVWFFKMTGKAEVVSGQRDAFRQFLGSVKFK